MAIPRPPHLFLGWGFLFPALPLLSAPVSPSDGRISESTAPTPDDAPPPHTSARAWPCPCGGRGSQPTGGTSDGASALHS